MVYLSDLDLFFNNHYFYYELRYAHEQIKRYFATSMQMQTRYKSEMIFLNNEINYICTKMIEDVKHASKLLADNAV